MASQSDQSFQYRAPRQPRGSPASPASQIQTSAPPPTIPAVLLATAVHAFRYVNGQHEKLGKTGAAVLGNHVAREYKVLLYYNQQDHVTSATVHPGFMFTIQPGNYGSFYDDHKQNWSIMFDSEKARVDFCKEVCLAKMNSAPSLDAVIVQDLILGEGHAAECGDTLEVDYTGWLLQKHTVGQAFDCTISRNQPLRLRIGAGKVIKGLEQGMLGSRKGGRRFLAVPPSLGYGSQGVLNQVPADSTLIFETEIRQVKPAKDKGLNLNPAVFRRDDSISSSSSMSTQLPNTIPNEQRDCLSPAKSLPLRKQPLNPDIAEGKLISPKARVEQTKLSFLSEAIPAPLYHSVDTMTTAGCSSFSVETIQQLPVDAVLCNGTDLISFLMTEARQHSTEIRLAVGKVVDKVDLLASKVDGLQKQWWPPMGMSPVSMDTVTIMHNIQRIIQENEGLREDISEKSLHIKEQNIKIGELINQVQRYMEQNNLLLEQRSDLVQSTSERNKEHLLQAEQEKVQLAEELASSSSRLCQLQLEAVSYQQKVEELKSKLSAALQEKERLIAQDASLELQVTEVMEELELMREQHRAERQRRKEAELQVCRLEEDLQDVKIDKEQLEQTLANRNRKWQEEHKRCAEELEEVRQSSLLKGIWQGMQLGGSWSSAVSVPPQLSRPRKSCDVEEWCLQWQQRQGEELQRLRDTVKRVMNGVFHVLKGQFDLQEMYSGEAVLETVMYIMKTVTMKLLDEIELALWRKVAKDEGGQKKGNAETCLQEVQQCGKDDELLEEMENHKTQTPEELPSRESRGKATAEEGEWLELRDDDCTHMQNTNNGQLQGSRAYRLPVSVEEESVQKQKDFEEESKQEVEDTAEGGLNEPQGKFCVSKVEHCPQPVLKDQETESTQSKSDGFPHENEPDGEYSQSKARDSTEGGLGKQEAESSLSKVEDCMEGELQEEQAPHRSQLDKFIEVVLIGHNAIPSHSGPDESAEGGLMEHIEASSQSEPGASIEGRLKEQGRVSSQSAPDISPERELMEHSAVSNPLGPKEFPEGELMEQRTVSCQSGSEESTEGGLMECIAVCSQSEPGLSTERELKEHRRASTQSGPDVSPAVELMEHRGVSSCLGPEELPQGGLMEHRAVSSLSGPEESTQRYSIDTPPGDKCIND
ncbi:FK506-binding protein 15-like isoform X1 [Scleropages formosus]|uniref:FK506-binding protein 15-like isoform X1 n=1 Tax=Scleropages formosus TaxID=113540 RepID=UPI0010FAC00B|nr:FK506-binding protein 15-like isoform X1 [Scleropages formosus]